MKPAPSPGAAPTRRFERQRLVRFSDCDPAGIIFYPQYFVLFNGLLEDWFKDALGISFHSLLIERRLGLPTVRLEADFTAVSRMGEALSLSLGVEHLGQASLTLQLRCDGEDGAQRMAVRQVLVLTSLATHKAMAMPEDLRNALEAFIATE